MCVNFNSGDLQGIALKLLLQIRALGDTLCKQSQNLIHSLTF